MSVFVIRVEIENAKVKKPDFELTTFLFVLIIFMISSVDRNLNAAEKYRVYFGSGTTAREEGIFSSILDTGTGQLTQPELAVEAMRPGIVVINPSGTHLYSIGKPEGFEGPRSGSVCAYEIDRISGHLQLLNYQLSKGTGPCFLQVDRKERNILVCHYRSGNCSVLPIAEDGSLRAVSSVQQHTGASVNSIRQRSPHPHCLVFDKAGRYVFVADLGLDQIVSYKFDSGAGTLTSNTPPFLKMKPGSGPRHFAFHPSGKFAYTNLELSSEVVAFQYDPKHGALKKFQTISTLPKVFSSRNANAGICLSPDGRFLYVSNRGHNSIAMYTVNAHTGVLRLMGTESSRGDVPQTISIDPSGHCLIETDKRAGQVRLFKIDSKTGRLTYTGCNIKVPQVGSIAFLPLD